MAQLLQPLKMLHPVWCSPFTTMHCTVKWFRVIICVIYMTFNSLIYPFSWSRQIWIWSCHTNAWLIHGRPTSLALLRDGFQVKKNKSRARRVWTSEGDQTRPSAQNWSESGQTETSLWPWGPRSITTCLAPGNGFIHRNARSCACAYSHRVVHALILKIVIWSYNTTGSFLRTEGNGAEVVLVVLVQIQSRRAWFSKQLHTFWQEKLFWEYAAAFEKKIRLHILFETVTLNICLLNPDLFPISYQLYWIGWLMSYWNVKIWSESRTG